MRDFLKKYQQYAVRAAAGTSILPELMLAQASLESRWGESELSRLHNNFFGIKKYPAYRGDVVVYRTREVYNGKEQWENAQFCKWPSIEEGFKGYIHFLKSNQRYKNVFLKRTAKEQAEELKRAGYATDPNYVSLFLQRLSYVSYWNAGKALSGIGGGTGLTATSGDGAHRKKIIIAAVAVVALVAFVVLFYYTPKKKK